MASAKQQGQNQTAEMKSTTVQKGVVLRHPLSEIKILDFSLPLIEDENNLYTPVYNFYEKIGLDGNNYKKKVKSLEEKGIDLKRLYVPTKGGMQKTLCINIFDLPALLYLITVSRLRPELRERVRQVQVETTKAIRNYWKLKVFSEREEIEKLKSEYNQLVKELRQIPTYEEYKELKLKYDLLTSMVDMLMIDMEKAKPYIDIMFKRIEWVRNGVKVGDKVIKF